MVHSHINTVHNACDGNVSFCTEDIHELPCGHAFKASCIFKRFSTHRTPDCPTCFKHVAAGSPAYMWYCIWLYKSIVEIIQRLTSEMNVVKDITFPDLKNSVEEQLVRFLNGEASNILNFNDAKNFISFKRMELENILENLKVIAIDIESITATLVKPTVHLCESKCCPYDTERAAIAIEDGREEVEMACDRSIVLSELVEKYHAYFDALSNTVLKMGYNCS